MNTSHVMSGTLEALEERGCFQFSEIDTVNTATGGSVPLLWSGACHCCNA